MYTVTDTYLGCKSDPRAKKLLLFLKFRQVSMFYKCATDSICVPQNKTAILPTKPTQRESVLYNEGKFMLKTSQILYPPSSRKLCDEAHFL